MAHFSRAAGEIFEFGICCTIKIGPPQAILIFFRNSSLFGSILLILRVLEPFYNAIQRQVSFKVQDVIASIRNCTTYHVRLYYCLVFKVKQEIIQNVLTQVIVLLNVSEPNFF